MERMEFPAVRLEQGGDIQDGRTHRVARQQPEGISDIRGIALSPPTFGASRHLVSPSALRNKVRNAP